MALLGQKFKKGTSYSQEQLIRDLIQLVEELEKELADIKQRLTDGGL